MSEEQQPQDRPSRPINTEAEMRARYGPVPTLDFEAAEDVLTAKHFDRGERCLVGHYDAKGYMAPSCIKCACFTWVRPDDWESHLALNEPDIPSGTE